MDPRWSRCGPLGQPLKRAPYSFYRKKEPFSYTKPPRTEVRSSSRKGDVHSGNQRAMRAVNRGEATKGMGLLQSTTASAKLRCRISPLTPGPMKPKLLTTIQDYNTKLFMGDAVAGVTVALVALPLSVAIAIASGADPKAGLVTAIIGGLLISALGGSRVQIGGPTGAFIIVVYGVIVQHGFDGLLLATLMAGIILVIGALLRAGRFIALVPEPVIEGFTVGIALIIAVSQLKDLFGVSLGEASADLVKVLPALWSARASINIAAVAVGVVSIASIFALRRLAPRFPGSMLVVVAASAIGFLDQVGGIVSTGAANEEPEPAAGAISADGGGGCGERAHGRGNGGASERFDRDSRTRDLYAGRGRPPGARAGRRPAPSDRRLRVTLLRRHGERDLAGPRSGR